MKKIPPFFLCLLSGLLLYAAWPVSALTPLIFIAWVPLLLIAGQSKNRARFFGWTLITLLIWNAGTTWWTCNSTVPGGIAAIVANSLLMSIPWMGFYNVKNRMGRKAGYFSLVAFWLLFEYIHLNWELSWPWLTLGNVFATHPAWIQWYEYTGVGGGSLWILCVNILIYFSVTAKTDKGQTLFNRYLWTALLLLCVPFAVSIIISPGRNDPRELPGDHGPNIVIVQPNIDPWDEKFVAGKEEMQLQKLIQLSQSKMDSATALIVWPETAVPVAINEDSVRTSYFLAPVWDFLKKNPRVSLLTGIEGFRFLSEQQKTINAVKISGTNHYAESYNSAVLMDSRGFKIYHKSKLVPGVETIPSFLHFMDSWFEKFGGATGSYAKQEERAVLTNGQNMYAIAPAICYESIYGEFMSKYVQNGANIIAIITNDGWWGNTAGYKQHENYARLRAIETRRWIVRSANTGISCFINPVGKVLDPQPWDLSTAIKMNIPVSAGKTFYVKNGDLIFKIACATSMLLLVWNLIVIIRKYTRFG